MRARQSIEEQAAYAEHPTALLLEVLLDIRDLLAPTTRTPAQEAAARELYDRWVQAPTTE